MTWRKSTYSAVGNCVEAGSWRKSSVCDGGTCVEAGHTSWGVGVRDTQQAGELDRTMLKFSASAWRRFTVGLKAS